MAGHGFIQNKLEIKFLILYITTRVIQPIPFDTVLDLTMCDDGIGYFDFSECLNDLVKTGHLTLSEDGLYSITDKGIRNSQICESSLPYSVRLRCDKNISIINRKLNLDDDMGSVMDLKLMVVREDMAKVLSERFMKAPEKLYSKVMDLLLTDDEEEES